MEFIPLALAIIVLLKVESSHADGTADMEYYRHKLAEHCDRHCNRACNIEAEQVHEPAECYREAGAPADGGVRRKKP